MIDFYKSRLSGYYWKRSICQASLVLGSAVGALLAYFGLASYVAVVVAFTAAITSYQQFHGVDEKLDRYSSLIDNLQTHLLWWQSLDPSEQTNTDMIYEFIGTCEDLIRSERQAWLSTANTKKSADTDPQESTKKKNT
jgi:hypothetical protein